MSNVINCASFALQCPAVDNNCPMFSNVCELGLTGVDEEESALSLQTSAELGEKGEEHREAVESEEAEIGGAEAIIALHAVGEKISEAEAPVRTMAHAAGAKSEILDEFEDELDDFLEQFHHQEVQLQSQARPITLEEFKALSSAEAQQLASACAAESKEIEKALATGQNLQKGEDWQISVVSLEVETPPTVFVAKLNEVAAKSSIKSPSHLTSKESNESEVMMVTMEVTGVMEPQREEVKVEAKSACMPADHQGMHWPEEVKRCETTAAMLAPPCLNVSYPDKNVENEKAMRCLNSKATKARVVATISMSRSELENVCELGEQQATQATGDNKSSLNKPKATKATKSGDCCHNKDEAADLQARALTWDNIGSNESQRLQ
eukprot:TRINITY_DN4193_c0_g3_i1.p2 TRINITY_DN4193_c0_g3~~TRINITY_DN4193_c0_g3_i1.p2  ORF type:complete len:380 (+),score=64.51 TRINITY_DN4193_c0_g3_i1:2689-3828(+)